MRITITTAYLLGLYSTLGIVRPLAEQLRATGFLIPTVAALFVGIVPLALGWRYTGSSRQQMIARIFLLLSLLLIAATIPALPEERVHFITYGLAGWLISWSLEPFTESVRQPGLKEAWLFPCLLVWLAGSIDEGIQWWLPMRVFDVRDILFNGFAGMTGVAIFATGRTGSRKAKNSVCTRS